MDPLQSAQLARSGANIQQCGKYISTKMAQYCIQNWRRGLTSPQRRENGNQGHFDPTAMTIVYKINVVFPNNFRMLLLPGPAAQREELLGISGIGFLHPIPLYPDSVGNLGLHLRTETD